MTRYIIFSDLDGTLLDHNTYSFEAAIPALRLVAEKKIPVILTSSKSLAEIKEIREELSLNHPFIIENGGAICFPPGYFPTKEKVPMVENFQAEFLGPSYNEILQKLENIRVIEDFHFKGFNDITVEEIMSLTALPYDKAQKAKSRLCSEPLIWEDTAEKLEEFENEIKKQNLRLLQGGRFYHLMGKTDKGKASLYLVDLYNKKFPDHKFLTIGIGDSPNDIEMLKAVYIPVLVQRPDGSYIDIPIKNKVIYADGRGPVGWNKAVQTILKDSN
jgi:mannosyl-3-phosphoglycerate phosphatase